MLVNTACLGLFDPTEDPITEEEITQVAAVAGTVKVADLRLWGQLRHLSPAALHRLMFSFSTSDHFTLQVNGTQLTDEHLHECGRRDIWRLRVTSESADAGSLAISDDGLLDYLFAPGYGTRYRRVVFSAFNASQKFVQKLISVSLRDLHQSASIGLFREKQVETIYVTGVKVVPVTVGNNPTL